MTLNSIVAFRPAYVQLGPMVMDDRDATTVQEHFSAAAAIKSDDAVILCALARAAFCTGDFLLAQNSWLSATELRELQTSEERNTGDGTDDKMGMLDLIILRQGEGAAFRISFIPPHCYFINPTMKRGWLHGD